MLVLGIELLEASQLALLVKNPPANAGDVREEGIRKIPWRRVWQSTPVFLPGESPWTEKPAGYKKSDTTERLTLLLYENYVSLEISVLK